LLALLRSGHVAVYWSIARMLQVGTFNLRHLAGRGSARPRDATPSGPGYVTLTFQKIGATNCRTPRTFFRKAVG